LLRLKRQLFAGCASFISGGRRLPSPKEKSFILATVREQADQAIILELALLAMYILPA
jgi:hypothetical protein